MSTITPVVLSGGSGSRLWPSSRSMYPKQFLKLVSENTMLQDTVLRLNDLEDIMPPVIVANNDHRFLVAEQLKALGIHAGSIILEPVPRNTAPAIALAALTLSQERDTIMLVLPSDHVIEDVASFKSSIELARTQCDNGKLVTFGIVPSGPETGYGYIKYGAELVNGVLEVAGFVEKPDRETAQGYLDQGCYSWNSGIFMFNATKYIEELERFAPDILDACKKALDGSTDDLDFTRISLEQFEKCRSDSIDYAVMEQTPDAVVVPLDVGWNDIGSWSALWQQLDKDQSGNVLIGDVLVDGVSDSLVISDKKLIAGVGVEDIILVETDDAILLAKKDRVQDVKSVVNRLVKDDRPESRLHRKVYRPWGYYDSIENDEGFQVKRLVVNPGAQLSLQMHHHRAEHWVVVKGTAEVINGDEKLLLRVNESTYIPIGATHSLANPGKVLLELIEVQSGDYLGEDDIVRFEDIYGRT